MGENLKIDQAVPTLTFEPFADQKAETPKIQPTEPPKPPKPVYEEESLLNEQEKKQVEAFAAKIDLTDSTLVLQYGAGAQKKIADFSDKTLENVRSKDLGETGKMLTDLVGELKQTGEPEEEKGFFASLFKKSTGKIEAMKARYEKAEGKVDEIVDILTKHQVQLIQDAAMLDQMYQLNQTYFKELSMYILAGKKKIDMAKDTELEALRQKAVLSATQEDAQAVSDYASMIERFEKKIHDLELTRMVALQMAPQIRMVQSNDTVMAEKIQSTIVNTIPLWKNQMVIAMGENHSSQAASAQKEVTDMTNQLLLSNAQKLKQTTVDIRRESERGIVDIETLKQTNGILIDTMNEIIKIQNEGRQQRKQAQEQLAQMEQQMREKLLEVSK
jgi:uncharacterized protein YaaN involved in tellurite resistance